MPLLLVYLKKVLKQLKLEFADEIDDTNLLFWGAFTVMGKMVLQVTLVLALTQVLT